LALSLGLDGIGCSVQPSRDFGIFETSLILEVKKTQRGVDKAASAILAVLLSSSAKNVNKDQRLTYNSCGSMTMGCQRAELEGHSVGCRIDVVNSFFNMVRQMVVVQGTS